MRLKVIDRGRLDVDKWDKLINRAVNGRVYALSWYLDTVCSSKWKAIVSDDYSVGMPLPINHKIPFFPRIAVPPFSQQLGIFYKQEPASIEAILDHIPTKYRQVVLQLNEENGLIEHPDFSIEPKPNYTLSLGNDYDSIKKGYAKRLRANLKNANKHELSIQKGKAATFIQQYIALTDKQIKVNPKFEQKLTEIVNLLEINGLGIIMEVIHNEKQLSTCLLTLFNNRLTYLMARSTEEGKAKNAMHFLLDNIIKEYCQPASKQLLLDFEGSSIKGLAHFFKSFGAIKNEYSLLKRRRFPF